MPFIEIQVPPGVVKSESDYAAAGRWIDCDHIRFYRGRPEKIGGTLKLDGTLDAFDGIARAAEAWVSYTGVQCLAFGTQCHLYIYRGGALSSITPYRPDAIGIALGTDPFAVVDTETLVTVTDTAHGITEAGTLVTFSGASAGGGITINGTYEVVEVVDANTFTIDHTAPATSTDATTGGASVLASYEINCGLVDPAYEEIFGWGVGGWGEGYWGVLTSFGTTTLSEAFTWSLDIYGEDLLINPLNGGLYLYDTSAVTTRPALITNAPTQVRAAFVTEERYIFALGCTTLAAAFDPMTVRWADILDPTIWTPADTNRSNERKLQGGTRLMGGTALGNGLSMVWSDTTAFVFQFTGGSTVYSSRAVGKNCGLIGPNAHCTNMGVAYWMSEETFHMYAGGAPQDIPNADDINDYVDVNPLHQGKSFAYFDAVHNEVWFCYPSATSTECDRYVMVALDENYAWVHGTIERTAAARYTVGEKRPVMFSEDGIIYLHDAPQTPDNDGAALEAFIELAPTDVDGGNTLVDIWGVIPDCERQTGDLSVYLYGLDHPRDGPINEDTVTVSPTDAIGDIRSGGRQFGMTVRSNVIGGDFRFGRWGIEAGAAGKKRGSKTA